MVKQPVAKIRDKTANMAIGIEMRFIRFAPFLDSSYLVICSIVVIAL